MSSSNKRGCLGACHTLRWKWKWAPIWSGLVMTSLQSHSPLSPSWKTSKSPFSYISCCNKFASGLSCCITSSATEIQLSRLCTEAGALPDCVHTVWKPHRQPRPWSRTQSGTTKIGMGSLKIVLTGDSFDSIQTKKCPNPSVTLPD